jgi:predicted nucleic acid-binding protein
VALEEVVTCLPVIQEVLQGFGDERAYRLAKESLFAFPLVDSPLRDEVFLQATELYRSARRRGRTIRSSTDCLIAASAIRHDLTVLHVDRDFGELAEVSALRHRRVG